MTGSVDRINAVDGVAAVVATSGAVEDKPILFGKYSAQLLRVDEEFQAEADELVAQMSKPLAKAEYDKLEARLRALPRHEVWAEEFPNAVCDLGARDLMDKYLAGSAYTAAIVMGLKGTGAAATGDTMASHAAWSEVGGATQPAYSGNRPAPSWSAATGAGAGSRQKTTSAAVSFTFNGTSGTVAGCFLVSGGSATKDNTTGILLSAGDFSGGSKTVNSTDVLNVTYTLSM